MKCYPTSARPNAPRVCEVRGRTFTLHAGKSNKASKARRAASRLRKFQFRPADAKACGNARDFQVCMGRRVAAR